MKFQILCPLFGSASPTWRIIMENIRYASHEYLEELKQLADKRRGEIRSTPNNAYEGVRCFFVSPYGNDENDGLSPHKAWRTLARLNDESLIPGSVVYFERDGIWRERFRARPGVTYTAYGRGAKPRFYGSLFNAASHGEWRETEVKDIYVYSEPIRTDIGGIFFDGGIKHSVKVIPSYENGVPAIDRTYRRAFASWRELENDLDFFHDFGAPICESKTESDPGGLVYLCSKNGNPSGRFEEIEFNTRGNVIGVGGDDVTFDNLTVMYGGSHGIGGGTVKNLTVKNCVIGFIGGSIQFYRDGRVTRFGNGIELYGGCENFTIENCYVHDCYDAGITHQLSAGGENGVNHTHVVFADNLIENCVYGIEYFLGKSDNGASRVMRDIKYTGNFIRYSGCGWGNERPDSDCQAAIKGWDHRNEAYDFVIENNIFECSTWNLVHNGCERDEWGPKYSRNVFIGRRNGGLARYGANPSKQYLLNSYSVSSDIFKDNEFCYTELVPDEPDRLHLPSAPDKYQQL